MAFRMETSSWPLSFGDQLQLFDDPVSFDLTVGKSSDACQDGMFGDDYVGTVERCRGVSPEVVWSDDYGYDGLSYPSNGLQSPLVSSPDPLYASFAFPPSTIFETKSLPLTPLPQLSASPVPELPSSPEDYFGEVPAFPAAGSPITGFVPGSFPVSAGVYAASTAYVAVSKGPEMAYGYEDCMEVGETEQNEVLFELDDEDNNVVIDHEKLASIGPFFPSVSLDDVLSLLPPTETAAPPASPVSLVAPSSASSILGCSPCPMDVTTPAPVLFVGSPVASPIGLQQSVEMNATVGFPAYSPPAQRKLSTYALSSASWSSPSSPCGTSDNSCSADIPDTPQAGSSVHWESSTSSSSLMTVLISSPAVSAVSSAGSPKPVPERRLRKKEQNKTAAQRYREKKRSEHGTVLSEYELLEKRNTELRAKVDDMSKEIAYLKGLIEEICA